MEEEWYEFTNEWTMRRDGMAPYRWILRNEKYKIVDKDQYRHDLIERHKLEIAQHHGERL